MDNSEKEARSSPRLSFMVSMKLSQVLKVSFKHHKGSPRLRVCDIWTSLASGNILFQNTPIFQCNLQFSGSGDDDVRLWKLDAKLKTFFPVRTISALGIVNSLRHVS